MFDLKIRASTSLIGTTGYNNHAQSFFRAFSKYVPLEIRNYTVGSSWKGYTSDEPHNGEPYMDSELKTLLTEQALWEDKTLKNFPLYKNWPNPGKPFINLVLNETDHHFFYQTYSGYKIAFNVWESTRQPSGFFNKLLEFDELWVPSKWQRACTIEQGYPKEKIFVIPEGVDTITFYPEKVYHTLTYDKKRFTFGLFGRWDYRKSTKEIIETFLKTFDKSEPVDLIVSIDNPFSGDGLKTTEDRLKHYGFLDPRIKILHLPPREEYVKLMKSCNVFLSCSRSEGWNLPLIEAMACGTPSIYSNCSGQLEFAEGKGLPVNILEERSVSESNYNHFNEAVGNYYEPDFDHLSKVMRDAYENYKDHKNRAILEAKDIHDRFNWDRVARMAADHLEERRDIIIEAIRNDPAGLKVSYHFVNGPHVDITGGDPGEFLVQFINRKTGLIEYENTIKNNMQAYAYKKYFTDWKVRVTDQTYNEIILEEDLNLKGKRVYIALESKSVGDTLAWFPPMEEFRKKHDCQLIVSTFHNEWFKDQYPHVEFVNPGDQVNNITAMYGVGWYYNPDNSIDFNKNPFDMRDQPMQKTAFDILGLDYEEVKPILPVQKQKKRKYKQIAIAIHATCQAKYWNRAGGWDQVIDWCLKNGYKVVLLSSEDENHMKNPHPKGVRQLPKGPIENVMKELLLSDAFVGIGSGLSWLSWALGVPTVLISGFSKPYTETIENTYRVFTPMGKCSGCFNRYRLESSDWEWCPDHKGTERMYECTRSITAETVILELEKALSKNEKEDVHGR